MKRCPECRRDYYDDSLLYCLDDGSTLLEGPGTEPRTLLVRSVEAGRRSKLIIGLASGLIVFVLCGIVIWGRKTVLWGRSAPGMESVAVLPLRTTADSAELEYLADGISDSLTNRLAQIQNLRVVPLVTSQQYARSNLPLRDIGNEMMVGALITGTLRKNGNKVNVSVSVINVGTGAQAWGDEFEEELSDIFSVQRRIAVEVATSLKGKLNPEQTDVLSRAPASSAEAYELYLRGRNAIKQSRESNELALTLFKKALELDQAFADTYAGVGRVKFNEYYFGWSGGDSALVEAENSFRHALALDPFSYYANDGLISVLWLNGKHEELVKLAFQISSWKKQSAETLRLRAHALYFAGLWRDSIELFETAAPQDPANRDALQLPAYLLAGDADTAIKFAEGSANRNQNSARTESYLAAAYGVAGNNGLAKEHYERAISIAPDDFALYVLYGALLRRMGLEAEALAAFDKGIAILRNMLNENPDNTRARGSIAILYAEVNDRSAVETEERKILNSGSQNPNYVAQLARAHALLKNDDKAIKYLHKALDSGYSGFYFVAVPQLDGIEHLGSLPRYRAFVDEWNIKLERLRQLYGSSTAQIQ